MVSIRCAEHIFNDSSNSLRSVYEMTRLSTNSAAAIALKGTIFR